MRDMKSPLIADLSDGAYYELFATVAQGGGVPVGVVGQICRPPLGSPVEPPHADLLFTLASLRDIVRGLHPHERVHFDAKSLLDA